MNHFEGDPDRPETKAEASFNQIYKKVADEILRANYNLNHFALKLIDKSVADQEKNTEDLTLAILERFNQNQGALSDGLQKKYISLAFSAGRIKKKMAADNYEFRQAAAAIAVEIAKKRIVLTDQELIKKTVTAAEKEMLRSHDETGSEVETEGEVV